MKLPKAIEILTDYHNQLPKGINDDYLDAIKLGNEALKYVKEERQRFFHPTLNFLPGETK